MGQKHGRGLLVATLLIFTIGGITSAAGAWRDISQIDRVTDKKISAFAVQSKQTVSYINQNITAAFVLTCYDDNYDGKSTLSGYIWFSMPVAYMSEGQIRFDQGEVKEFRSSGGTHDGSTINIAPYYKDFSDVLKRSSRFRIEAKIVTGREFFEFDTSRAADVLAKLPCR